MSDRAGRILFLAMDAGNRELIKDMVAAGEMPSISSLLEEGLAGNTESVAGVYEGATWPSFHTGVNPGRHGIYRTFQLQPGTYRFRRVLPGDPAGPEPFWEALSRAGKKVAILDVPLSRPVSALNGIQTIEWGAHDEVYGFSTWPPGLRADLLRRFGAHPTSEPCDAWGRSATDFRASTERLLAGVELKRRLTLDFLGRADWDFFAQVFTEGHCAGHQCWHLHDPRHPDHDPACVSLTGDPVRQVYHAIDRAIGDITAAAGRKILVVFLASHCITQNFGANFLLADILERLGVLHRLPVEALRRPGDADFGEWALGAARRAWKVAPRPLRKALAPRLPATRNVLDRLGGDEMQQLPRWIDLRKSTCLPHQNAASVSGIRINQAGREPAGSVQPGSESDDLCRRLSEDLLEIVDGTTGQPAVRRVMRTADLFHGDRLDGLPDLLVEWSEALVMGSKAIHDGPSCRLQLSSPKIGTVEGEYRYCRTGDHRPEGLFVAAGPGIRPGALDRTVSIMDFAPTFLACFGIPVDHLDGMPIAELCAAFDSGVGETATRR